MSRKKRKPASVRGKNQQTTSRAPRSGVARTADGSTFPFYIEHEFPRLFRILDVADHADAFCRGEIFVSTLSRCRAAEDIQRGDTAEGTLFEAEPGPVTFGASGEKVIDFFPGSDRLVLKQGVTAQFDFSDLEGRLHVHDAALLCLTTDARARDFGDYCIEIRTPHRFFECLTKHLFNACADQGVSLHSAQFRPVTYRSRHRRIGGADRTAPEFAKDPRFAHQKEVRMLWICDPPQVNLTPGVAVCSELAKFCKRIR